MTEAQLSPVKFETVADLPTEFGEFRIHVFSFRGKEHVVLTLGEITPDDVVLTRVHSECLTGDGLFSLRCDCGPQLNSALKQIQNKGAGLLIYLRQEGRGIGLTEKIKAYALQDNGEDTYSANIKLGHPADNRNYDMLKDVFAYFGVKKIDLLTNNPDKILAIEKANVSVETRIAIKPSSNSHNRAYLQTKKDKFGHL